MNYPKSFTDLVECFKRLPGIGGKSAERLAYHVLSMDKEYVQEFANVLAHFQDNIHYCKKCGHICEGELCEICKDETRDQSVICEAWLFIYGLQRIVPVSGCCYCAQNYESVCTGGYGIIHNAYNCSGMWGRQHYQLFM